jgi:hypothetical protein
MIYQNASVMDDDDDDDDDDVDDSGVRANK